MCTNTTVRYGGLAAAVGNTAGSRRYLFINFSFLRLILWRFPVTAAAAATGTEVGLYNNNITTNNNVDGEYCTYIQL